MKSEKANSDKQLKREMELKFVQERENITVSVLKGNHLLNKMQKELADCYKQYGLLMQSMENQGELLSRCNMVQRLLMACAKMLGQQKMQLWMINDEEIKRKVGV